MEGTRNPPDYLPSLISDALIKREYDGLIQSRDNLLLISALMSLTKEQFNEVSDLVYRFDRENKGYITNIGMED